MHILRDKRQDSLASALQGLTSERIQNMDLCPAHVSAMLALAQSQAAAFARDTYEPGHFTASAFVLSPDRTLLLLILHSKLKLWLQPGGHVEATDQDMLAAARREVFEETGLSDITVESSLFDVDVHEIPPFKDTPAHLHHDVRALFVAHHLELKVSGEVADAQWFDLHMVAESTHDLARGFGTDDSVRRAARRLATSRSAATSRSPAT